MHSFANFSGVTFKFDNRSLNQQLNYLESFAMSTLVEKPAAGNKTDTLMSIASDDFNVAESKILENTALVTQKDSNRRLILHWAAVMGKERLVELLLNFKECPVDDADDTNATPLILATLKGSLAIVKMLLDRGANVNHQNTNGHTPVKYAGSKNHKELLVHLLDVGGDPNARDHIGDTPLHRVASMEHHDCLRVLLTHPKSCKTIAVNAQNNQGNTALHLACENDDATSALLLIGHGAAIEIQNKAKETPLDLCKPPLRRKLQEKLNISS